MSILTCMFREPTVKPIAQYNVLFSTTSLKVVHSTRNRTALFNQDCNEALILGTHIGSFIYGIFNTHS